jgi:hypothetical protein
MVDAAGASEKMFIFSIAIIRFTGIFYTSEKGKSVFVFNMKIANPGGNLTGCPG